MKASHIFGGAAGFGGWVAAASHFGALETYVAGVVIGLAYSAASYFAEERLGGHDPDNQMIYSIVAAGSLLGPFAYLYYGAQFAESSVNSVKKLISPKVV